MLENKSKSLKTAELRPFLIPGVVVIFILFSGLFLIRPRLNEMFLIRKNLKREEKRLAQLVSKTAALEGLDQVELSEKAEITAKALPAEKNLPLLLSVIKGVAVNNNIELLSLQVKPGELATPSAKERKQELPSLSFTIMVSGQMSDFKEFLDQLSKTAPLMRSESIALEEMGGEASFVLGSPFLRPPESLGLPEKPLAQVTSEEEEVYQQLARLDFFLIQEEFPLVPAGKENPFAF